jgi:hypothetical protein
LIVAEFRLRGQDRVDPTRGVAAVLGAVGGINRGVDVVSGLDRDEGDVFVDAAALDVAFRAFLRSRNQPDVRPFTGRT